MTPVVAITVNNRPQYLAEALGTWQAARGIDQAHLIFRVEPGNPECVLICREATLGASREVVVNPRRYGALGSPWHCFESGFATGADFVILGEDDSLVSADILEWFQFASERWRDNERALAVCAFQHRRQPGGPHAAGLYPWFKPTIWGTWRDRWDTLLRGDWDFDYRHKGWDWRIIEHWIGERGYLCAAPAESRSQVSGEHGGTHLQPGRMYREHLSDCWQPDYPAGDFTEVGR